MNFLQGHSMCKSPEAGKDRLDVSGGPQLCMCLLHLLQSPCQGNFNKTLCFLSPCPSLTLCP